MVSLRRKLKMQTIIVIFESCHLHQLSKKDMTQNKKLNKQLELTNEQTSPLFRIMWIQNKDEPHRRDRKSVV